MFGRHGMHRGGHRGGRGFMNESGGRRGGGPERGFEHGKLRYVLLKLIADKPSHGYELIKAIEERTGGAYTPSPGVVYPTLTLLEEMGAIVITLDVSDGQRKLCQITAAGRKLLAEHRASIEEVEARLMRAGKRWARSEEIAAPIVRAMENLHTALRLRLQAAAPAKEQVHAIAAALDAAATSIERV
jgi:DNA-binding PadR family transcriptional regulator